VIKQLSAPESSKINNGVEESSESMKPSKTSLPGEELETGEIAEINKASPFFIDFLENPSRR